MKRVQTFRTLTGAILATSMLAGAPMAQAQQMPGMQAASSAGLADRDSRWGGREQGGERKTWSGGRGNDSNRAERAAPQRAERAAPQQRAQRAPEAPRAAERQGREWNRSDRRSETAQARSGRDWNQSQDRGTTVRSYPERAQRQAPSERVQSQTRYGSDRDRTYRDRDRNTTYSGRDRDGDRRWSGSRDGRIYRDGDRHRDGDRYRDRDGRYADRDRHHRWDHHWRNNSRYDWQRYRTHNHHIYRMGHYYSPYRDYRYRRLSIGFTLGSLFYGSRYWINDPWRYRLPDVYGPYRWVRYYDDVLLVDMYSGEVVDVIYDFFW